VVAALRGVTADDLNEALLLTAEIGKDEEVLTVARMLLDAGADPNTRRADSIPIVSAVARRHGELARELLRRGADPDVTLAEDSETFELSRGHSARSLAAGTELSGLFSRAPHPDP
jgi:ankyrin repeat protein